VRFWADPAQYPRLKAYVQGVVGAFAKDQRILAWDVWNEPNNTNGAPYHKLEPGNKVELIVALLPQVFAWARSVTPSQPLTSGVWEGDYSAPEKLNPMQRIQLEESDVISFHSYEWPEEFEKHLEWLERYHRPILCTEFMARLGGKHVSTQFFRSRKKASRGRDQLGVGGRQDADQSANGSPGGTLTLRSRRRFWFHEVFPPGR